MHDVALIALRSIEVEDTAFCNTCITAGWPLQHKMKATSVEPAFVNTCYIIIGYRVKIISTAVHWSRSYATIAKTPMHQQLTVSS